MPIKIQVKLKQPPSFKQGGRVRWVAKIGSKLCMDTTYTSETTAEHLNKEDYQKLLSDEKAGFLDIIKVVK